MCGVCECVCVRCVCQLLLARSVICKTRVYPSGALNVTPLQGNVSSLASPSGCNDWQSLTHQFKMVKIHSTATEEFNTCNYEYFVVTSYLIKMLNFLWNFEIVFLKYRNRVSDYIVVGEFFKSTQEKDHFKIGCFV